MAGRSHFVNAIQKYGKEAFAHEVLDVCDSLEAANAAEGRWIEELGTRDPARGFNLLRGGAHMPHPFSSPWDRPEYRKKMEEHVLPKLIAAGTSPEAQAKMRTTLKTPEARARFSEVQKGKVLTEEHRAKISKNSAAAMRSKSSDELLSISRRMTAGRRKRENDMTDLERRVARERHSATSRLAGTAAALHTPDAISRHREVCAAKALLDLEKIQFALRLLDSGLSCSDVGWLLKVSKYVILRYRRRASVCTVM